MDLSKARCSKCNEIKSLDEFKLDRDFLPHKQCIECERRRSEEYSRSMGHKPMSENKKCGLYLGVHIAERVLENEFKNVTRMPNGNPGYDYICAKGYKIDVKSSSGRVLADKDDFLSWTYNIKANQIADYFLCLAFGSRADLNPLHLWLIPGDVINLKRMLIIKGNELDKWSKYERPLDNVIMACNHLRCDQ